MISSFTTLRGRTLVVAEACESSISGDNTAIKREIVTITLPCRRMETCVVCNSHHGCLYVTSFLVTC